MYVNKRTVTRLVKANVYVNLKRYYVLQNMLDSQSLSTIIINRTKKTMIRT